jgi:serine/threonine protein kinase
VCVVAKTAGTPAFFAPEVCGEVVDEEDEGEENQERTVAALPSNGLAMIRQRSRSAYMMNQNTGSVEKVSGNGTTAVSSSGQDSSTTGGTGVVALSKERLVDPLEVGAAIDVWALGVTLFCLVYGRVPFTASSEFELFRVICTKPYVFIHSFFSSPFFIFFLLICIVWLFFGIGVFIGWLYQRLRAWMTISIISFTACSRNARRLESS